jgi:hypothetical protein
MKRILLVLVSLFSLTASMAQPMHQLPTMNLIAWYPFCSSTDVMDRTLGGFDLLSSGVSSTTDRYGRPNQAYNFDGIASEMHYTTTFTIPAFGIADFTYSCHIYPTVAQNSIILYNGNPTANGLGLVMNNGIFGGGPGNVVSMLFGGVSQSVGAAVTLNQWHHLLMRRNGNSYLLYIDGVLSDTYIPPTTPGYVAPTSFFQLGCNFTGLSNYFTGKIDDVALYDRQVSNTEMILIRDFNPFINFTLGNDTSIAPNVFYLGAHPLSAYPLDTVTYPNRRYIPTAAAAYQTAYGYLWNTGDSTSWNSITFPMTPVPDTTRTLTITRWLSCPAQRAITVRHIVPVVNIGRDTILCTGSSVVLNPTPTPGVTYSWSTGASTPSISVSTSGTYWVVADSTVTIGSSTLHFLATDTAIVSVSPLTSVTLINDTTLCRGGTVTLSSSDSYYSPTYRWSDGVTTTPSLVVSTTGTYWLEVTDSACVAADTVRVTIVYDTLTVFNPDTAICQGAFVIVRATSSPDITYQWTPTAGVPISNVASTTISPDTSATYVLEGRIILGGVLLNCRTTDTLRIEVQPNPKVLMGGNRSVCEFDTIRITPTVTPGWYTNYIYDWTPGTFLDDSTSNTAIFTAGDTTKIVLTVTTPAGCAGSDSMIVFKYNGNFAMMKTDTAICPGDSVVLFPFSTETGITTYVWSPSTYVNDTNLENPVIKPINNISYRGIATSQYGCKDTISYDIVINPGAVIHLEDSAVIFPGESHQITPITNCIFHAWTPPVGLNDTALVNPVATPPINTVYILTGMTEDGCMTKDSIRIRVVSNSVITVPNAFAPGSLNGTVKVILRGIARLRYFRIYNRWGGMVFESTNIANGWDGTIGGVAQPAGVYVYEAEAVTSDGQIIQKQGNITLLK